VVELALFAVLVVFTALAARMLRGTGAVAHWIAGWAAAGIGGFIGFMGDAWPRLELATHPLGTLYAALLLSGTLLFVGRRVPSWLFPAALAWGGLRAGVDAGIGTGVAYALGFACEPFAVAASAYFAIRSARRRPTAWSERWLGPALAILALAGFAHLGWLAAGRSPSALAPLWIVVAPFVFGVQIQAAADRLRRAIREQLEARVAERTAALAASEERYRAISALSTDFAFKIHIDSDLQLVREWVSGAFSRTLGMEPHELDGRGWIGLIEPAERDAALADLERVGERPAGLDVRLRRRDGSHCVVHLRLAALERTDDGTLHILGSGRDVTELKHAESERERLARHVEQVERLESLGILAGGIAHDFNNLLTVIRGSARLALADLPRGATARPRVERIAAAAEHAASLTEEMLAYAGKSPTALVPLDLCTLVRDMEDLLRASVGAHCALELQLDAAAPPIDADASGIRRVLLNLVINASEALGGKAGRVTVDVSPCDVTRDELDRAFGHAELAPGRSVALEVRDDGCGMDPETARRIFQPFFSTKFSGRGLGMAAVLGIVHTHRGAIRVVTEPGRGTAVRVVFAPSARRIESSEPVPIAPTGAKGARVLVVDDDAGVVELASEVLERAGHRVAVASGGCAALDRLRADPNGIDVVVLDLAMPDLGGEQVFLALRELRPDLPVILVTGYDSAHAAKRFAARGLDGFLRKPWEPEDLVAAVDHALAQVDVT
jgi:PAS domain S-box-containing protein